jgi:alpha-beta hydrolase superfamily lysophospholipase
MLVDLIRVNTADGVRLDGALLPPSAEADSTLSIDAAILIHGTGGAFYSSTLLESIAQRLSECGAAALLINTRGHDLMSTASAIDGPRRQGAAYEEVSLATEDLNAWIALLESRSYQRIALIGHSLGAVKAVFSQAEAPHAAIARVAAISPPRLSCSYFLTSPKAEEFRRTLEEAEEHVRGGRGQTLMEARFPMPMPITAAGYVDKYGREERYHVLKHAARLTCPTLFTFGTSEVAGNAAFSGMPEEIERLSRDNPLVKLATIAGADHFYSGCRSELIARLEGWLRASS